VTVADLHPEDLLEKDASGRISDAERVRLHSHLALCATCRFDRQLRVDFANELRAEDVAEVPAGLSALQPKVAAPVRYQRRRVWSRPRARTAWLLAAATLLVGGVAAATGVTHRIWSAPAELTSAVLPAVTEAKTARVARAAAPHVESPAEVSHTAPAEAQEAPVVSAPAVVAPPPPPSPPAPAAVAIRLAPRTPDSPPELLDEEGEARRQGDYERVVSLHRQLVARYPGSREAQVSRATVGRLLLDRGNPADALTSFDAYLGAGSGALEEEALVGRATALERLGRRDEASRAWRDLLAAFPESPYAAHARTRLGGLSGN
jgi:TolA-binding protein